MMILTGNVFDTVGDGLNALLLESWLKLYIRFLLLISRSGTFQVWVPKNRPYSLFYEKEKTLFKKQMSEGCVPKRFKRYPCDRKLWGSTPKTCGILKTRTLSIAPLYFIYVAMLCSGNTSQDMVDVLFFITEQILLFGSITVETGTTQGDYFDRGESHIEL